MYAIKKTIVDMEPNEKKVGRSIDINKQRINKRTVIKID